MDHALQPFLYFKRLSNKSVSILVLMDHALQQMLNLERVNYIEGFNPCFNGSRTSTS